MGDSILSGLREHKMSHMRHYSVPLLMKQPKRIILHIGTNDAPFLTPENMFKEFKELQDFILKFLPDVKLIFSTPIIRIDKSNKNDNNRQFTNCLKKAKFDCIHHTNITEAHLNVYGLHINGYDTRVLAKNLISGAHAI